jgi:hypothetical protein
MYTLEICSDDGDTINIPVVHESKSEGVEPRGPFDDSPEFDLGLMSWDDVSEVPTSSGENLVVVGTDYNGLLHIRIFDAAGICVVDTDADEMELPDKAEAIATLKEHIATLKQRLLHLPPYVWTSNLVADAEKDLMISAATSIVGRKYTPLVVGRDIYTADYHDLREFKINKICLFSDTHAKLAQFTMLSALWTLSAGDKGCWELTIKRRSFGRPDAALEFQLTEQDGERVNPPLVFQWLDKGDGEGEMVVS